MKTRKKEESKIDAVTDQKPGFIEGWKGALPTKPWPTAELPANNESDNEENVEWHRNSRGQWYHERKKPMRVTKMSDPTKSVVDLYDSTDDEQTAENENSRTVAHSKSTMFSSSKKASTGPSLVTSKKALAR